jgi:DNA-binding NarL/FixJ family response regulator
MAAVAICSADPNLRHRLERLLRAEPTITVVGVAGDLHAVARLVQQTHVDAMLADAPPRDQLNDWLIHHRRTAFIAIVDETDADAALDALHGGASAILRRSANRAEIAASIEAATNVSRSCRVTSSRRCSMRDRRIQASRLAIASRPRRC